MLMPQENPVPLRKHSRRINTPGDSHFLTFSCFKRQPFLTKNRSRQWLADSLAKAQRKHPFRLIAYVFMPEHVHLLLFPQERPYAISDILTSIKTPVARKARRFVLDHAPAFVPQMLDIQPNGDQHIRFWQRGGGHDRNIFTAEELWEKIHYIHNNPVKRKLVEKAVDWEWSSARHYAKGEGGPVVVDNRDLPWISR